MQCSESTKLNEHYHIYCIQCKPIRHRRNERPYIILDHLYYTLLCCIGISRWWGYHYSDGYFQFQLLNPDKVDEFKFILKSVWLNWDCLKWRGLSLFLLLYIHRQYIPIYSRMQCVILHTMLIYTYINSYKYTYIY